MIQTPSQAKIHIGLVEKLLSFKEETIVYSRNIKEAYQQKMFEKFLQVIQAEPAASGIAGKLEQLSQETVMEFMITPEVTRIINYWDTLGEEKASALLHIYADAELARVNGVFDREKYDSLWTALGDRYITYDNDEARFNFFETFSLPNGPLLDFFSLSCTQIDKEELDNDPNGVLMNYGYEEAVNICNLVEDGLGPIFQTGHPVGAFISEHSSIIAIRKQEYDGSSAYFVSSSSPRYIGRIILVNPEVVPPEKIIDAVVHETVHNMLFMIEECSAWMPSSKISLRVGHNVPSHWTGRKLDIRNYLHAICVWYSLYQFWKLMLAEKKFSEQFATERMSYIKKGFSAVNISAVNKNFALELSEPLMQLIDNITRKVNN